MNIISRDEIILSVREGILLCIENEIKGADKQLKSFDSSKKLATNQLKTFRKNLECLYEEVTVTGGGESGQVILRGLKNVPTSKVDKRKNNGRKPTKADLIMKEYLFNTLCRSIKPHQTKNYTVNQLVNLLDLLSNPTDKLSAEIESELYSTFATYYTKEQTIHIKSNAIKNISTRKESEVKLHLQHLQKENRIEIETIYNAKYLKGSMPIEIAIQRGIENNENLYWVNLYTKITEKEYCEIILKIKKISEVHGFNYQDYVQANRGLLKKDAPVRVLLKEVKELLQEYNYDYIYTSMNIEVLNYNMNQHVEKVEAKMAFADKLIFMTNERMKKKEYTNKSNYIKQFYRLVVFIVLRKLGVNNLNVAIDDEILQIGNVWDEMNYLYNLKKGKEEVDMQWAFENKADLLEMVETPIQIEAMLPLMFDNPLSLPHTKEGTHKQTNEELEYMQRFSNKMKPNTRGNISTDTDTNRKVKPNKDIEMVDMESILDDYKTLKKEKKYSITFGNSFIISDNCEPKENVDYKH
ncbi:hypothetical protein GI482_00310 [Bacillus sp. N3536]|nr:hypothetical protein GI482_00310 [Bacillus sp. N3536]